MGFRFFIKQPGQREREVDLQGWLDAQEDPMGFDTYKHADMLNPGFQGILGRAEVIPDDDE